MNIIKRDIAHLTVIEWSKCPLTFCILTFYLILTKFIVIGFWPGEHILWHSILRDIVLLRTNFTQCTFQNICARHLYC